MFDEKRGNTAFLIKHSGFQYSTWEGRRGAPPLPCAEATCAPL